MHSQLEMAAEKGIGQSANFVQSRRSAFAGVLDKDLARQGQ
jgi:hypothetical protein